MGGGRAGAVTYAARAKVHVGATVRTRLGKRALGCLAERVQLTVDGGSTSHVVPRVHKGVEGVRVRFREPIVLARECELADEIAQIGLIQIHVLVDVCEREKAAALVHAGEAVHKSAAIDVSKRGEPVGEETAT